MTIGSLAVNITATTDKFTKGIEAAKSSLGNFVSGIGAAQAAVAAFSAYGLVSIVTAAVEAGGALYEMTQKLHVSAESLSALHYAADQLESSAHAVDAAIGFMTKTLGKATQGVDPAVEAFNRLNIDFEKLKMLSVDQQFLMIIDALHKMTDVSARAAAAQAIFGKGAKELSALIAAGTEEIIKQGDAAAATGAIISSETASNLDEAGDAIKSFADSWTALKTQLVGVFAPALTVTMTVLSEGLKALKGTWYAFQYIITGGIEIVVRALAGLQSAWNAIMPSSLEIGNQFLPAMADELSKQRDQIAGNIRGIGSAADNPLAKSATSVSGHVQTQAEEKAQAKVEQDAAKKAAKDKKEEEKQIAAAAKKQNTQLQELINQGNKRGPVIQVVGVR